jgi:hypothetical protein
MVPNTMNIKNAIISNLAKTYVKFHPLKFILGLLSNKIL